MNSLNLAARAGRWSAAHWKTAVAVWVAFVAVAIGVGTSVGTHKLSMSEQSTGETARAEQILASAGFKTPASEAVLVRSHNRPSLTQRSGRPCRACSRSCGRCRR